MINNNAHHLINHVLFIVDKSGSMSSLTRNGVIRLFDEQVAFLSKRSRETDQETHVALSSFLAPTPSAPFMTWTFSGFRASRTSIGRHPRLRHSWISTIESITDLRLTPEKYGDHAFITYVITDGYENSSRKTGAELRQLFNKLPDNWTVACLVPDNQSKASPESSDSSARTSLFGIAPTRAFLRLPFSSRSQPTASWLAAPMVSGR